MKLCRAKSPFFYLYNDFFHLLYGEKKISRPILYLNERFCFNCKFGYRLRN